MAKKDFNWKQSREIVTSSSAKRWLNLLFVFCSFADDAQRVLAAIKRLAIMGIERSLKLGVCTAKLGATPFTDSKGGIPFHDPQFALCHEDSLAPNACANETAPVPGGSAVCRRSIRSRSMAAGLSGHVWSVEEIVMRAGNYLPKPAKRGPYNKK